MTITEKVAYLKGMFDGMNLDTEKSKEAKLLGAVIDILEEMGASLADVDERFEAVGEEIDALSDDLSDVEEIVYDEDEDDAEEDDDNFFEIECPNCGEPLCVDEEVLDEGTIQCPACEQKFVLDLSDEECECGCGHDHDHGEASGDDEELSF